MKCLIDYLKDYPEDRCYLTDYVISQADPLSAMFSVQRSPESRELFIELIALSVPTSREGVLLKKALSCKAISDLYLRANATATPLFASGQILAATPKNMITLKFVAKTESGFPANANWASRTIEVLSSVSDDQALSFYVFELTNFVQAPKFYKILQAVTQTGSSADCEAIAKNAERIEFEGMLIHDQVLQAAAQEMGWNCGLDIFRDNKDFESYWLSIKSEPYADYWRKSISRIHDAFA